MNMHRTNSFETVPSFHVVVGEESSLLGANTADDNLHNDNSWNVDLDSEDDEDNSHSAELSEPSNLDSSGHLILPSNRSSVASARAASGGRSNLSVPDSVPSDLRSLRVPNPILVAQVEDDDEQEPDLLGSIMERRTVGSSSQASKASNTIHLAGLAVAISIAILSIGVSFYMFQQSRLIHNQLMEFRTTEKAYIESLQETTKSLAREQEAKTKLLEEQIRRLEAEAAYHKQENHGKKELPHYSFPWEHNPHEDTDDIVNNCWVHAKAKMELGQCTRDATNAFKENVKSFGQFATKKTHQILHTVDQKRSELIDDLRRGYDDVVKDWYQQPAEQKSSKEEEAVDSTEPQKITTTQILKGAGFALAGAAAVSILDSFLGRDQVPDP